MDTSGLGVFIFTLNAAKQAQPVEALSKHLEAALRSQSDNVADLGSQTRTPPDIIALGIQETAPLTQVEPFKQRQKDRYIQPYLDAVHNATLKVFGNNNNINHRDHDTTSEHQPLISHSEPLYELVAPWSTKLPGLTSLLVFVRGDSHVSGIKTGRIGCGTLDTQLKGAVALRFKYNNSTELTFVTAHLTSGEGLTSQRNKDYRKIVEGLALSNDDSSPYSAATPPSSIEGIYKPGSHLFFFGDLNYRSTASHSEVENIPNKFLDITDDTKLECFEEFWGDYMQQHDELQFQVDKRQTLYGLREPEKRFPPTYKFKTATKDDGDKLDGQIETTTKKRFTNWFMGDPSLVAYSTLYTYKTRVPSWTDRIFYMTDDTSGENQEFFVYDYNSIFDYQFSDHRPVYLWLRVPIIAPTSIPSPPPDDDDSYSTLSLVAPVFPSKAHRQLGIFTQRLLAWGLFLTTTPAGNVIILSTLVVIYLVKRVLF